MIDVAAELRRQGWMAGFLNRATSASEGLLKERWQALEQIIADGEDRGLLIVLDYAESRAEEVTRLTEALLAQEPAATRPLRLVLLARGAGAWWQALIDEKPEVHRLFYDGEGGIAATELPAIKTGEQRLRFFRHCLDNFTHVLRGQGLAPANQAVAPDRMRRIADGEGFARPLAIQMEALLQLTAATPAAPGIHEQLRAVLGLERDHWAKLLGGLDLAAKRDMDRGVAQVTAVNGVPNRNSAERILMADAFYKGKREARVDVDPVYRNLAAVYGGPDGALIPLEPDLIGEHQVATAGDVELIEGCLNWIEGEPEGEREKKRRDLITVLQRASLDEHGAGAQAQAKTLLQHLVKTRLTLLAPEMIAVLIETRGALEGILTQEIAALGDEPLTALDSVLPLQSLALMDVSLAVAHRRAQLSREFLAGADAQAELDEDAKLGALDHLSARLGTLGIRLSNLGRREEALAASQEAVDLYRRLAETRPDAFLPDLAMSLNNLGTPLRSRPPGGGAGGEPRGGGHPEAAGRTRPDAFLPDLAGSLRAMAKVYASAGEHEAATPVIEEGLTIIATLVARHPHAFEGLARSLGQDYLAACEKAANTPNQALLDRVANVLGPQGRTEGSAGAGPGDG